METASTLSLPVHWERHILAAYLRMMGSTQVQAAKAVGRSVRTIRDWEADKCLWDLAREEARKRWMRELVDVSRGALLAKVRGGDGDLAFRILERVEEELAPPAYQMRHSGDIDVTMHVRAARERVGAKLTMIAKRQEGQAS